MDLYLLLLRTTHGRVICEFGCPPEGAPAVNRPQRLSGLPPTLADGDGKQLTRTKVLTF